MEVRAPFEIPELWSGRTVFIIGGGPSLAQVDLTCLESERVIAVNQAFRLGPWVDVMYFGDCNFYNQNRKTGLKDFGGLILSSCQRIPAQGWPGVNRLKRTKPYGLETVKKNAISWNNNSGASAINIALHFGAKKVVLLGFDMHGVDGIHHYHSYYEKRKHPKKWNPYPRHLKGFSKIAEDAQAIGLEIINATPDSAITDFPYVPLEEII